MDGKQLTRLVLDLLDEEAASSLFAKQRVIFDYLDAAAVSFSRETEGLKREAVITTVADQQTYDLPPDFISLYMKNSRGRYFAKYYDTANYSFPIKSTYEKIFKSNLTTSKSTPNRFCIRGPAPTDWASDLTRLVTYLTTEDLAYLLTEADGYITTEDLDRNLLTGTVTATHALSAGESILEDSAQDFLTGVTAYPRTPKVYPRDFVHNLTDESSGMVLGGVDDIRMATALFEGSRNSWLLGDQYVIVPNVQYRIMLDAPSETAGHTFTLPYISMPAPVYSDYCQWRFSPNTSMAIAQEAAFLYQNQKGDYNAANRHHQIFGAEVLQSKREKAQLRLQAGRYRQRM